MAIAVWTRLLAIPACSLFALLVFVGLFGFGLQMGDEGYAVVNAWRLAEGQVPVRDFTGIPPFSYVPTALTFRLFGVSVAAERGLTMLYAALLLLLVDRLMIRFRAGTGPRCMAIAFLIPYGVYYWPMPSHHWVVVLLQLGCLLALFEGTEKAPARFGSLAGVLAALACFTMQDQGGYLVLALLAFFFPFAPPDRRRRLFAAWVAGGLVVAAVFAAWLLRHVTLGEIWYEWVVFPLTRYRGVSGNRGSIFLGWEVVWPLLQQSDAPASYRASLLILVSTLTLLPAVWLVSMLLGYGRRWYSRAQLGLLLAGGIAFLGGALHRWSLTNAIWAAPIWVIAAGVVLGRMRKPVATALITIVVLASVGVSVERMRNIGHAAVITGRAGSLRSAARYEAHTMQLVLNAIEQHVPEGAPVFCDGYLAMINFLSLRPNPTRHTLFIYPGYNTQQELEEVVRSLEALPQSYVLATVPAEPENALQSLLLSRYRPLWVSPWGLTLYGPVDRR